MIEPITENIRRGEHQTIGDALTSNSLSREASTDWPCSFVVGEPCSFVVGVEDSAQNMFSVPIVESAVLNEKGYKGCRNSTTYIN